MTSKMKADRGEATDESSETYPVLARQEDIHPLAAVSQSYLLTLRDIAQTVRIVIPHLSRWQTEEITKYEKKVAHFIPKAGKVGESGTVTVESARDFAELTATLRTLEELHSSKALPVLAREGLHNPGVVHVM